MKCIVFSRVLVMSFISCSFGLHSRDFSFSYKQEVPYYDRNETLFSTTSRSFLHFFCKERIVLLLFFFLFQLYLGIVSITLIKILMQQWVTPYRNILIVLDNESCLMFIAGNSQPITHQLTDFGTTSFILIEILICSPTFGV